jgi:transcriptional regulator with XRE-family HTH domain
MRPSTQPGKSALRAMVFSHVDMSPRSLPESESDPAELAVQRVRIELGAAIRSARRRRGRTLRTLAADAAVSPATAHAAESGAAVSMETYARLGVALGLRPEFSLAEPHRTKSARASGEDPVHAAMGEMEAAHLGADGSEIGVDEPYQHYQFAGRADVLGWRLDPPALIHIENRTDFPNVQEAVGSFTAKRAYLAPALATRLGVRRWASITHVMAALRSAEVIHTVRLRRATFAAVCPDSADSFEQWWNGSPPPSGTKSTLVFIDPAVVGTRRRLFRGLDALDVLEPRYRGYADALSALKALDRA